jgi:ribosomal protein S18 acetylase RimI-like enzyme
MPELAFEIRPYSESDEAAVIGLWNTVFPDPSPWNDPATVIAEKLTTHRELFLVGLLDGEPVGTVMGGYDGHRGWIYLAAVAPEHQRSGFGRRLIAEVESRLVEYGCTKLNLQVRADNEEVVSFYLGMGYAVEDRISMGKRIP